MPRKKGKEKGPICLVPGCDNPAKPGCRGQCGNCRATSHRRKEAGLISYDELVQRGLMLPARPGSRPSKLDAALAQK